MEALIEGAIYVVLLIALVSTIYDTPVRRFVLRKYYEWRYK
jgi:hypothetical protein